MRKSLGCPTRSRRPGSTPPRTATPAVPAHALLQTTLRHELTAVFALLPTGIQGERGGMKPVDWVPFANGPPSVEKAAVLPKQDLRGCLSGIMTVDEVKNYLSLHHAAQKRPTLSDKQQLQWCELLGVQEPRPARSKPQPTFISGVSRFLRRINKEVCKRPLNEWTKQEREQMQDVLKPIIDLHKELDF